MKKILVITPYERDANSFWRCMGPMTYLQKHSNDEIQITLGSMANGVAWCDIMQYDLVFLHRPCRQDDLTIMQIAYNCGVPTWVDYDDWLFNIPSWNRTAQNYHHPGTQNIMAQCLASADVVSCSTQELLSQFSQVNPSVILLSNAYRSDLYTYRKDELEPRENLTYWRGSDTHDGDLLSVKEGFKGIKSPISFLGGATWMLLSSLNPETCKIIPSKDVIMYYEYIYSIKPKVCVFPLVDCLFNRCKSNIAYIEAVHAGAICVAPLMPEWKKEGIISYKPHDSDDFSYAVNYALGLSEPVHQDMLKSAFKSMKSTYDISIINRDRIRIVEQLTSPFYQKPESIASPFDQQAAMKALMTLKRTQ